MRNLRAFPITNDDRLAVLRRLYDECMRDDRPMGDRPVGDLTAAVLLDMITIYEKDAL